MKYFLIILTLAISGIQALAQTSSDTQNTPITIETTSYSDVVRIEATNSGAVPYTVLLTCDLLNMNSSEKLPVRKVVVPSKKKVLLTRLTPVAGQTYNYKYNFRYYLGNTLVPPVARGFVYQLPFEAGKQYVLVQGNNGAFSHSNKSALDFAMPENSTVCAARSGIVASVKQDSGTGCPQVECKGQGNYVILYHEDGSYATYAHLRLNGSLVKVGQSVTMGEPIGYSGNTGWSSAPHLHFDVAIPGESEKISIPVTLSINGLPSNALEQGKRYSR